MKKSKEYPICEQGKTDCFANRPTNNGTGTKRTCEQGYCRILYDTHFNRECPFYKGGIEE